MAGQTPQSSGTLLSRVLDRLWYRRADLRARARLVEESGLFDAGWYAARHGRSGSAQRLLLDYLRDGNACALDPNPLFDAGWYLSRNPDVRDSGGHPLLHYLQSGGLEGRDPHPLFDGDWYLLRYPDVRRQGLNPLVHYLRIGARGGCDPSPFFRTRWYLEQYPDVGDSGENPLRHYIREGAAKGYDPNPLFDSDWYLKVYPDVAAADLNPLVHYVLHGEAQRRAPSPLVEHGGNLSAVGSLTHSDVSWPDRPTDSGSRFAGSAEIDIVTETGGSLSAVLEEGIAKAAAGRRHLLVQLNGASVTPEQRTALVQSFAADPMIGAVVPRLSAAPGEVLSLLPAGEQGIDRAALTDGPHATLAPDFLPACVLIRNELVANLPKAIAGMATLRGQLRALLAWARRAGFRILIDHRVVGTVSSPAQACPEISPDEREHLLRLFPDVALADAHFRRLACHYREAIAATALAEQRGGKRRILIDCSGLHVGHSGTSEAIIGILDGVATLDRGWSITIHARADAIEFHDLERRYPSFGLVGDKLTGSYSVALRLSQPWLPDDLVALHRHARKVAVLVLDTIGWDTIYAITEDVDATWRLLAATADGIAHISAFTKDRFNFRFPVPAATLQVVSYLSCHYDDYVRTAAPDEKNKGHILIVGNAMQHKGLSAAIEFLPKEFPDQTFVAIGSGDGRHGNLTSISSGQLSDQIVEQLHANARMLIYPSFYEGFGFPLVRSLAYGLDVVARRSDLLFEIGAQCEPRGRLIPFDDPPSMIDAVRRALADEAIETVPLGTAIPAGGHALRWRDVAERLAVMVDELAGDTTLASYDRREFLISCVPTSRDG